MYLHRQHIADAGAADGPQKRHAGNGQRRGRTEKRGNIGIHFAVDGNDLSDDLNVVNETFGKQRADRAVDQTRSQCLLFSGPSLALEETAGNASRSVRFFNVIHGQRKEITARCRLLEAHRRDQHHRVAHGDEHRAVGLTCEFARLNGYGVIPILKTFFDSAHVEPLAVSENV